VAELLPYRKDDMFYPWRFPLWSYFARRGVVFAAVDLPGTGSSSGKTIAKVIITVVFHLFIWI
jgi:hypothetical protein